MSIIPNQNREGARVSKKTSTVNAAMERLQKVRKFKHDSQMHLKTRPSSSGNHESSDDYRVLKGEKLRIPSAPVTSKEKRSISEPPRRPIPDVPKTAEFAYFKKFKEEMGSNCREQVKIAGESGQNTDELENPRCQYTFSSPPRRDECESAGELNSEDEFRKLESKNSASPDPRVIKRLNFDHCGDVHAGKGVVVRNKSRQLGVANSYPEDGEGCSKGFDSVPGPGNHLYGQSYGIECSRSEERRIDSTDHLASSRDPYNEENISTMQSTSKLNHTSLYNADFPECWLDSPRKRVISKCSSSEDRKMDYSYQLDTPREPYNGEDINTLNFGPFGDDDDIPEYWLERPRKRVTSKWDVADVSPRSTEYNAGISPRIEEMDWLRSFPEHQHDSPRNRVISKWDDVSNSGSPSVEHCAVIGSRIEERDRFRSFPEHQHDSPRNRVISKWDDVINSISPSVEHYTGISSQMEEMNSLYSLDGEDIKDNVMETDLFCYQSFDDHRYIRPEHDLRWMDRAHDPSKLNHVLLLGWDTNHTTEDKDQYTGFSSANSAEVASQQTWDNSLAALDMHESSSFTKFGADDEDDPCSIYTDCSRRFLPDGEYFEEDYTSRSRILELPFIAGEEDHVSSLAFVPDFPYALRQDDDFLAGF